MMLPDGKSEVSVGRIALALSRNIDWQDRQQPQVLTGLTQIVDWITFGPDCCAIAQSPTMTCPLNPTCNDRL